MKMTQENKVLDLGTSEGRAEVVAAIREFADRLEKDDPLSVPFCVCIPAEKDEVHAFIRTKGLLSARQLHEVLMSAIENIKSVAVKDLIDGLIAYAEKKREKEKPASASNPESFHPPEDKPNV